MTGAILRREFVVPGRKLHTFLVRGGYALLLAATFGIVFLIHLIRVAQGGPMGASIRMVSESAQWLFNSLVAINIMACLVFTPAYVASAISQEKDQRTIQDLLLTTMSTVEIILSKLLGRLAQVLLVLAAGLPLVAICSLLGGVSGSMLLALSAVTLLWVITAGAFTLFISVLVRRTRDAILGSYALGLLLLVGIYLIRYWVPAMPTWVLTIVEAFNPFTILAAAWGGTSAPGVWYLIGRTTVVLCSFSALAVFLAGLLVRPLGVRQLEVKGPRRFWRWRNRVFGTPDERPMLWKERCFPPAGRITQLLQVLGMLVTVAMIVLFGIWIWLWNSGRTQFDTEFQIWMFVVRVLLWPVYLSLLLTSSSAFAGERERVTWDALLTSPLESREIVLGKLAGALWEVRWWMAAIAVSMLQLLFISWAGSVAIFPFEGSSGYVLLVLVTGSFGGVPGIAGISGEMVYLVGVGLRTSLSMQTSGKSLAITLMIWLGSGIVFWIVLYAGIGIVVLLAVLSAQRLGVPPWLSSMADTFLSQLVWLGPLLIALFWGGIGIWLIRSTIVRFDALASRMQDGQIRQLQASALEVEAAASE